MEIDGIRQKVGTENIGTAAAATTTFLLLIPLCMKYGRIQNTNVVGGR
jgi:hypothetical protein